jgi:pimeloyl-ACP methyl ester carboxylesterase
MKRFKHETTKSNWGSTMPFVENQGVRIHYEVEGRGPPVLLLHGLSSDYRLWYGLGYVKELSKDYELILVDARGHGASDKPHNPEAYDMGLMVGDLVAILDDRGIPRASFFGYSMGGRVGFRIPLYAPTRFGSLILGGAVYPIHGDEDAKDEILVGINMMLDVGLRESPDNPMAAFLALMERSSDQKVGPAERAVILSNDARALQALILEHRRAVYPRPEEALPRFTMPCLLLVGEADPRYPVARECARRMPNVTLISLPGLDHMQGLGRSDIVLPHVKRFLASHTP